MKAEISADGKVTLDLAEMVEGMSGDALMTLADTIACQDEVIKQVANQLVVGWTDSNSHGLSSVLREQRTRIGAASGELAAAEIARLTKERDTALATIERMSNTAQGFREGSPWHWKQIHKAQFAEVLQAAE